MHIENVIFLILSKNAYTKFSAGPLAPLVMYIPFFLLFLVAALFRKEAKLDLDMIAFWGVMITHFSSYIRGTKLFKRTIGSAFFYRLSKPYLDCISEALIFLFLSVLPIC